MNLFEFVIRVGVSEGRLLALTAALRARVSPKGREAAERHWRIRMRARAATLAYKDAGARSDTKGVTMPSGRRALFFIGLGEEIEILAVAFFTHLFTRDEPERG